MYRLKKPNIGNSVPPKIQTQRPAGPATNAAPPTTPPTSPPPPAETHTATTTPRVELPTRVDERQMRRPNQFPQQEPRRSARDQNRSTNVSVKSGPTHLFNCNSHQAVIIPPAGAEHEKRHQRQHIVLPRQPPALPPEDHQQAPGSVAMIVLLNMPSANSPNAQQYGQTFRVWSKRK